MSVMISSEGRAATESALRKWQESTRRQVIVTLEKPWHGGPKKLAGAFQIRCGTDAPTENPNFDGKKPKLGPPFWPGKPIMWPAEGPCQVGASFYMTEDAAKTVFGDWDAPEVEDADGVKTRTRNQEKERLASQFGGYKRVPGNGNMMPDMTILGPPDVPHVKIVPLGANMLPIKGADGSERAIRPFEHFGFDDDSMYAAPAKAASEEITAEDMAEFRKFQAMKKKAG